MSDDADLLSRWRGARLAAVAEDIARLGHDLRGILSPALLAAERLQGNADPAVKRSAEVVLRAVDRAAAALGEAVGGINRSVGIQRGPVAVHEAVVHAVKQAAAGLALENRIARDMKATLQGDHLAQLLRSVLAGAEGCRVIVSAGLELRSLILELLIEPPPSPPGETESAIMEMLARAMGGSVSRSTEPGQEAVTLTLRRY